MLISADLKLFLDTVVVAQPKSLPHRLLHVGVSESEIMGYLIIRPPWYAVASILRNFILPTISDGETITTADIDKTMATFF